MHMWGYINGSSFGVTDQRQQFITFQFQITHLFSTTEVNSSHIIVQIECTFSWKSNKMGIFKEDFLSLPVLHITFNHIPVITTDYLLTLKAPEKSQLYGHHVYYVVHICDFGISRVKPLIISPNRLITNSTFTHRCGIIICIKCQMQ